GRLVRLVRVLCLALVLARRGRHIVAAVIGADQAAGGGERLLGDVDAVGAHIGNEADGLAVDVDAFIEPLRDAHGVGGREAELAACVLLQRRRGERRRRVALGRLGFDIYPPEVGALPSLPEGLGLRGGGRVWPLGFFCRGGPQGGLPLLSPPRGERRHQR